ncbi:carbohydrate-binding family 9-like protein [Cellvibrio sp. UBA7661]|uniref:carbohydrate-binding family 9-like protein n=1 Tax=Cellvibrio sp. UBA7661 TaxID=1946311 RepID=UPI002F359D55
MYRLFAVQGLTPVRFFIALAFIFFATGCAQVDNSSSVKQSAIHETIANHVRDESAPLNAAQLKQPLVVDGEIDSVWATATPLKFNTDWQGRATATPTQVRALWAQDALYLLWELENAALRNTDHQFSAGQERNKLYDEDCVEIFIAPNPANPYKYAEIEVGPFGHFMDLWVDRRRKTHESSWSSNVSVAATQNALHKTVVIEMEIRAPDITRALVAGAQLPIGLYRLEGNNPRQYLAAFPTHTRIANFHVPDAFGVLVLNP